MPKCLHSVPTGLSSVHTAERFTGAKRVGVGGLCGEAMRSNGVRVFCALSALSEDQPDI
jgi:hypothetical protein